MLIGFLDLYCFFVWAWTQMTGRSLTDCVHVNDMTSRLPRRWRQPRQGASRPRLVNCLKAVAVSWGVLWRRTILVFFLKRRRVTVGCATHAVSAQARRPSLNSRTQPTAALLMKNVCAIFLPFSSCIANLVVSFWAVYLRFFFLSSHLSIVRLSLSNIFSHVACNLTK